MIKRNSSIELLRVLSMLMIISGHMAGHGILHMTQTDIAQMWSGGTLNKLFSIFLIPGGRIGVGLFFLITGYFQITKKDANIKKVIITTLFYGMLIGSVAYFFKLGSIKEIARGFIPIQSCIWWYISTYVILTICSPWINDKLITLTKKKKVLTIIFCWVFLYTIPYVFNATYYSISRCVLFYLLGAFIRIGISYERLNRNRNLFIVFSLLAWIEYISCGYLFYSQGLTKTTVGIIIDGGIYNALIVPICTICIAGIFIGIPDFYSSKINTIATTTFGIYLLHDNYLKTFFWDNIIRAQHFYQSRLFPVITILYIPTDAEYTNMCCNYYIRLFWYDRLFQKSYIWLCL